MMEGVSAYAEPGPNDTVSLIREIYADVKVVKVVVKGLQDHADETDGAIANLNREHLLQQGALMAVTGLMRWTLAGIGAGAALAGVILAVVAK